MAKLGQKKLNLEFLIQIEQAAYGCISGTLKEWPVLSCALREFGLPLSENTEAIRLKEICKKIINSDTIWFYDCKQRWPQKSN